MKTLDGIAEQVNLWRGERSANGVWYKTISAFAVVTFAALLGFGLNRVAEMHRDQMAKQQEIANQIAVVMARLQNKAHP